MENQDKLEKLLAEERAVSNRLQHIQGKKIALTHALFYEELEKYLGSEVEISINIPQPADEEDDCDPPIVLLVSYGVIREIRKERALVLIGNHRTYTLKQFDRAGNPCGPEYQLEQIVVNTLRGTEAVSVEQNRKWNIVPIEAAKHRKTIEDFLKKSKI